jgi:hypothetical protein
MKASHVSPSSQYRVVSEELEWIGRLTLIAQGAVPRTAPANFLAKPSVLPRTGFYALPKVKGQK